MLRNVVAIGVRLNRTPSEVSAMSVEDYELLCGYFTLENQEAERASARQKAESALARRRR